MVPARWSKAVGQRAPASCFHNGNVRVAQRITDFVRLNAPRAANVQTVSEITNTAGIAN